MKIPKTFLKKNKVKGLALDIKIHHKVTIIKTVWYSYLVRQTKRTDVLKSSHKGKKRLIFFSHGYK